MTTHQRNEDGHDERATPSHTAGHPPLFRVGGKLIFVDRRDGQDVEHADVYEEIARPKRLVFNFSVSGFPTSTRVIIDIVPASTGCDLTLTHEGVPQDALERNENGWKTILQNLGILCT